MNSAFSRLDDNIIGGRGSSMSRDGKESLVNAGRSFEFTASICDRPPSRSTSAQRAGEVYVTSVPSGHEPRSVAWCFLATAECHRSAKVDTTAPNSDRRDQGSRTGVGGAAAVESESFFV